MRVVLCGAVAALLVVGDLSADDKKPDPVEAKKLVGKWEPKDKPAQVTAVMEFTKDGKIVFTVTSGGEEEQVDGTYKIDGNKLTLTLNRGGFERKTVVTLSKLTDAELVGADEKGKVTTLLRLKDK